MGAAQELMKKNKKLRNTFYLGSDEGLLSEIPYWVSTGCWPLDATIGGGIPGGRLIEVYGDESTGKSLFGLYALAQAQRNGGIGILLDSEATTTMEMAQRVGVDVDDLLIGYPNTVEEVYDHIEEFLEIKTGLDESQGYVMPALIVWDSIASTISEAELASVHKDGTGKPTVATKARAMSKMLQILPREFSRSGTTGVFINQTRDKIGVLFGQKKVTPGGKSLKFHSSVRIELAVIGHVKAKTSSGTDSVGVKIKATIVKNKVDRPFGRCTFPIMFDEGIDNAIACLWYLKDIKIVSVKGGWLYVTLNGEEIKFRKSGWYDIFKDNYDYLHEIVMTGEVIRADAEEYKEEED